MNFTMRLLGITLFLPLAATMAPGQTTPFDKATTPTCIPRGFLGPSTASPPDGAVYRVGEPVLVESDPYFATLEFCWFDHIGQDRSVFFVSRDIHQSGLTGVTGQADPTEVLHFNVPGTVIITRTAYLSMYGPISTTQNTITIIDDGPRPFPEPVSAPPGEEVPRIEADRWRGHPVKPVSYSIITEDNSFSQLRWTEVKNTGNAPLVIFRIINWIGIQHNTIYPRDTVFPLVILPGQVRYIPFGQDLHDPASYLDNTVRYEHLFIESNDPVLPIKLISHGTRRIFPSAADIPDDYPYFPPEPPVVRDNFVCNDTNFDGTVDAGDIVTSILRSAP